MPLCIQGYHIKLVFPIYKNMEKNRENREKNSEPNMSI